MIPLCQDLTLDGQRSSLLTATYVSNLFILFDFFRVQTLSQKNNPRKDGFTAFQKRYDQGCGPSHSSYLHHNTNQEIGRSHHWSHRSRGPARQGKNFASKFSVYFPRLLSTLALFRLLELAISNQKPIPIGSCHALVFGKWLQRPVLGRSIPIEKEERINTYI